MAKLAFKAYPHMRRIACGYALGEQGPRHEGPTGLPQPQEIQHTVRYTELSPTRLKNFWR